MIIDMLSAQAKPFANERRLKPTLHFAAEHRLKFEVQWSSEGVHEVYTAAIPIIKSCTSIYNFGLGFKDLHGCHNGWRLKLRGIAYIGTGICDAYVALHGMAAFNFAHAVSRISFIGNLCFLYANLATLIENLMVFQSLQNISVSAGKLNVGKLSAFLGILNSLGYIVTSALALFGASTAVTLLISIFAINAGCLKAIIDYSILAT